MPSAIKTQSVLGENGENCYFLVQNLYSLAIATETI